MFSISDQLLRQVREGKVSSDDLVLRKTVSDNGRVTWIAEKCTDEQLRDSPNTIKGEELRQLFQKAAKKGHEPLPGGLGADFRQFSRQLPEVATKSSQAIENMKEALTVISSGIKKLKREQKPWKMIDLEYALREVVLKDSNLNADDARNLIELWKSSSSEMGFRAWLKSVQKEWTESNSNDSLTSWLGKKDWEQKEKEAYLEEYPHQTFSEKDFIKWQKRQTDPHLPLSFPLWHLKQAYREYSLFVLKRCFDQLNMLTETPEADFDAWLKQEKNDLPKRNQDLLAQLFVKTNEKLIKEGYPPLNFRLWSQHALHAHLEISDFNTWAILQTDLRTNWWRQERSKTGGIPRFDPTNLDQLKKVDKKLLEYNIQRPSLPMPIWIEMELWKKTRPKDTSFEAFKQHVEVQWFGEYLEHSRGSTPIPLSFKEWQNHRNQELIFRWKPAEPFISFDDWKEQQEPISFVSRPFVRLGDQQRKAYLTRCENGVLTKGGALFSTALESTEHTGRGHVIFVIGPDQQLYTASHIRGVFHHSSFFGAGAVMAAGEILSDENGKILFLSSISGHYKPSKPENIEMLKWFESRGADLDHIDFAYFDITLQGFQITNARDYMNS